MSNISEHLETSYQNGLLAKAGSLGRSFSCDYITRVIKRNAKDVDAQAWAKKRGFGYSPDVHERGNSDERN